MPAHSAAKLFSPPTFSVFCDELLEAELNTSVDMLNRMEMRIFVARKSWYSWRFNVQKAMTLREAKTEQMKT